MAKIPMGNFGTMIAASAPRPNIPSGAYKNSDGGIQAGNALIQLGGTMLREDQQRQQLELQKQNALDRAKAANSVLDREIAVDSIDRDIQEQVSAGKLPYTEAPTAYKKRVDELGMPEMTGLDPVTAENFTKGVKRADFKGQSSIDSFVAKEKTSDFKRQAEGILDKLGKQAGLPGADMATISTQIDSLDDIGRTAYGAGWDKRKQDWKDNTWDARLNQQAMATRNDVAGINALQKQITEGEYADKLDSNRRNTLVAKLDGYKTSLIQRNEAAAARAARQQEAALKRAEAEFNTFQGIADKGAILSPEYVDRAIAATKGTPYQAGIVALSKQAQEVGGLAFQPIRNQQATLDNIDRMIAKGGRTPELDKRREQIDKVLRASQNDLKENGLRAGLERGVINDLAPIDVSSPEAMAGSFAKRIEQADHVSAWAGKSVSPLDAAEADQVRSILEVLPARQRAQAVSTIAQAVGPRYATAIAQQLDAKDKPLALAFATSNTQTSTGRYTSELILKGATAIKDGAVAKDDKKVTGWKATIASELDGIFPNEVAAQAAKESAYYIAAGLAAENGGSVSGDDIKRSVRLAIDGSIIERNGKRLPVPAGWSSSDLEAGLRNVPTSAIIKQAPDGNVRVGGVEMPAADFVTSLPGQELMYAGQGRYAVIVKGRPVTNAEGRPIIIGVK